MVRDYGLEAHPGSSARRSEAARVTQLMEASSSFSYLRLGDGELALLLEWQQGQIPNARRENASDKPVFRSYSVNGLERGDYNRLLEAYQSCSYLDTFERVPYSAENFHRLRLSRRSGTFDSPRASLSQIFYEWGYCELPAYVKRHRSIIAGAEGKLLGALLTDRRYQVATEHFWGFPVQVKCVGIRNNGREYWTRLDQIKRDLTRELREFGADTLFLSLASGAKILCREIAEELNVKCFDLGAALLALTYSATPGNSVARNSHNPYYFRVPLDVYIDSLHQACPELSTAEVVAKAQAQLCFDLLRKEPMNSFVPEIHDPRSFHPTPTNLRNFIESKQYYLEHFYDYLTHTPEGRQLDSSFRIWCAQHGLGVQGKLFRIGKYLRRAIGRVKRAVNHAIA